MFENYLNKLPYRRESMSYSPIRQFHQEPSLKDVLTTILDNLRVSKQGTVGLVSLLDTDIKLITNENDNNLFKFKTTEINYDFGDGMLLV